MPGMLFHMMIYARMGGPPILATLNDIAPIAGCVRWQDTHERPNYDKLALFLVREGASDIVSAMDIHLAVDDAMHGPRSPIYPHMLDITSMLNALDPHLTSDSAEGHARLAELVVETSLDGLVANWESPLFDLIKDSQRYLDIERLSLLFADFFHRDRQLFRWCFSLLHSQSPHTTSSMDGLAESFLSLYEETSANMAGLTPPEPSASFYAYMRIWFTDPRRMQILRKLEKRAKEYLVKDYEALRNLDFPDKRSVD